MRGLLSGAEAASLKGLLERAYAAADNGTAHVDAQERVRAWGGVSVHLIEQFGIDEQELIPFLGMVETRATKEVGPCKLIPNICVFRRHRESRTHVPWHIDSDGAGTMSYDPCVNIWIPLVSVGRSLPSLEVIPGRISLCGNFRYLIPRQVVALGGPMSGWIRTSFIMIGSWHS